MAILGRRPPADIVIPSPMVSAAHAEIRHLRGDIYLIRDLGSSNGTYVNGRRVGAAEVRAGDALSLGSQRVLLAEVFARLARTDRGSLTRPLEAVVEWEPAGEAFLREVDALNQRLPAVSINRGPVWRTWAVVAAAVAACALGLLGSHWVARSRYALMLGTLEATTQPVAMLRAQILAPDGRPLGAIRPSIARRFEDQIDRDRAEIDRAIQVVERGRGLMAWFPWDRRTRSTAARSALLTDVQLASQLRAGLEATAEDQREGQSLLDESAAARRAAADLLTPESEASQLESGKVSVELALAHIGPFRGELSTRVSPSVRLGDALLRGLDVELADAQQEATATLQVLAAAQQAQVESRTEVLRLVSAHRPQLEAIGHTSGVLYQATGVANSAVAPLRQLILLSDETLPSVFGLGGTTYLDAMEAVFPSVGEAIGVTRSFVEGVERVHGETERLTAAAEPALTAARNVQTAPTRQALLELAVQAGNAYPAIHQHVGMFDPVIEALTATDRVIQELASAVARIDVPVVGGSVVALASLSEGGLAEVRRQFLQLRATISGAEAFCAAVRDVEDNYVRQLEELASQLSAPDQQRGGL